MLAMGEEFINLLRYGAAATLLNALNLRCLGAAKGGMQLAMGKQLMVAITAIVLVSVGVLGALVIMSPAPEDVNISAIISAPNDGATITGVVNVTANITTKSAVSYAILKLDGVELGNRSQAPFYWHVNSTHYAEGQHILNLTAFNAAKKQAGDQITVTVNNGGTTASITSPTNGSKVAGQITIVPQMVSPRDITYVTFALDGVQIGNQTSTPYSQALNTSAYFNGNHTIAIRAVDSIGMHGQAQVTVWFDNPFTIRDERGKNITFASTPTRIVSLGSSFTEVLFAIEAQGQVVGVDSSSNYPAAALNKTNVGSFYTLNKEMVVAQNPDCIITWAWAMATIESLESSGYKVVAYNPASVNGVMKVVSSIGNLTGHRPEAGKLVQNMTERITQVTERVKSISESAKVKVYFELRSTKSVGPGSIANEMIALAGGINIYANSTIRYPIFNSEYIIGANPDIIVIENQSTKTTPQIESTPGWSAITAVQDHCVFRINGEQVSATPRLVIAIEQMVEWFYPA